MLAARPRGPTTDLQALARALPPPSLRKIFLGGLWTNLLNPKVALFFLAFLPQFISPETADKALVFLALGVLFNVNSIPMNAGWALAAAWMGRREVVQGAMHWLNKVAGAMFIAFGLRLALADRPGT